MDHLFSPLADKDSEIPWNQGICTVAEQLKQWRLLRLTYVHCINTFGRLYLEQKWYQVEIQIASSVQNAATKKTKSKGSFHCTSIQTSYGRHHNTLCDAADFTCTDYARCYQLRIGMSELVCVKSINGVVNSKVVYVTLCKTTTTTKIPKNTSILPPKY